jgi:glycosyltransferase involved in cell wall biosynthesis
MKHKVSFIIPALNEERRIAALIDNIKMLNENYDYEIIVSDGFSTDRTAEIAESKGAIVVKDRAGSPRTIANGRNSGAELATGEFLIFCDADTVIKDPDVFLSEVFSVFQNPKIIGGAPSLKIFPHETILKDRIDRKSVV